VDVSRDAGRARAFLSSLMRLGRTAAVVDFVVSAGRLKLHLAKENVLILFAVEGARSPRPPDAGAAEALAFLRARVNQRAVEVKIESLDTKGCFMGSLYYPPAPGAQPSIPLARALVDAGLAQATGPQLREAEAAARAARLGLWRDWSEESVVEDADAEPETLSVMVSEVRSGSLFFFQRHGDAELERVAAALEVESDVPDGWLAPKPGALVKARYTLDDKWYRARVVTRSPDGGQCGVLFVDFGNEESLPLARLAPLDAPLAAVPPLALCASLAYLKVPPLDDEPVGEDAALLLSRLTGGGRLLSCRIESRERSAAPGTPSVFVTLQEEGVTDAALGISATLLREGLARLARPTTTRARAAVDAMRVWEDEARTFRRGIWELGDVDSDEE
jgi:staphylococcal nuclease domain-containing protein 1